MNEADGPASFAREPQRLARRTRRRQGLPETVTDPRVIARIVLLLTSGGRHVGGTTPDGPGSADETGPHRRGRRPNLNAKPASDTLNVRSSPSPVFTPPVREGKPTFGNTSRA